MLVVNFAANSKALYEVHYAASHLLHISLIHCACFNVGAEYMDCIWSATTIIW